MSRSGQPSRRPLPDEVPAVTDEQADAEYAERVAARRAAVQEKLEERRGLMIPAEDPDYGYEGEAWPAYQRPDRDAVLQPPKPELRPSPKVIEHAAGRSRRLTVSGWAHTRVRDGR